MLTETQTGSDVCAPFPLCHYSFLAPPCSHFEEIIDDSIEHVNKFPTIQFFSNTQTKSSAYMLSLTECGQDFLNHALWDSHYHALLMEFMKCTIDTLNWSLSI